MTARCGRRLGRSPWRVMSTVLVLMGAEVVEMDAAELLVDDAAGAGAGGLEIEALVLDDLLDLLRFGVVAEERDGAVAIGEEVDFVADPEGFDRWSCRGGLW